MPCHDCVDPPRQGLLSALPDIALELVLSYLECKVDRCHIRPRLTYKWLCLSFDGCNTHLELKTLDSYDNATDSVNEARLKRRLLLKQLQDLLGHSHQLRSLKLAFVFHLLIIPEVMDAAR